MSKYIFCTGGVISSVGKGITAASIGRMLKSRGIRVAIQKLDPYINVDPGTMSPYQHGEVFVTEDGAETDLDLGHYERFIDENLNKTSNVTTGQIYSEVIARERQGGYLGSTVQVIPHITDEIKRRIKLVEETTDAGVVIVEVGGTVGDIEGLPFLEAIRQMRKELGRENTLYIHLTLLPYIAATGETKTKPTQHSVRELRGIGIQPDVIVCRSDFPINEEVKAKISLFCDVEERAVIPLVTADNIYEVPLTLESAGLGDFIIEQLGLTEQLPDMRAWGNYVEEMKHPRPKLRIGLVGKYIELRDAYISVREALYHAGVALGQSVEIVWIDSGELEEGNKDKLEVVDGIVVPGGFGYRGIEGKIIAARYAREQMLPYLGLCLGLQVMVIELARYALGSDEPNSTEFNPTTRHPVIALMSDQYTITNKGGTMRLGAYPCYLVPGTKAAAAYCDQPVVWERHRHRFEVNNAYRELLQSKGMILSGLSPDGKLAEIVELADHPWMVSSQFHPEFKSRPNYPPPLFRAFVAAARTRNHGQ